jgi:hypothetical protein
VLLFSTYFAIFTTLSYLYLNHDPQIRFRLEWYLRFGVSALMGGVSAFVVYGVFS